MDYREVASLVAGMVGPIILACGVFLSRKRRYANWAKTVYVVACLVGLLWGILGFIVWPIGSLLSVLIARRYEKTRLHQLLTEIRRRRPNQSLEPTPKASLHTRLVR